MGVEMNDIKNRGDLNKTIDSLLEKVLNDVALELIFIFQEYIVLYVYKNHSPNSNYYDGSREPTGQFLNAWEWTNIKRKANLLVKELWYNWETLDFDSETYLHGSRINSKSNSQYPDDARENLPAILEGKQSNAWLSVKRNEKFWQQFIKDYVTKGLLKKLIEKHLRESGFQIEIGV